MHDVVTSGTGLWVAPEVVTSEELVASYNAYIQRYNAQRVGAIAVGELTALAELSAELIEKALGTRQRHAIDRVDVLDPTCMCPRPTPRSDDALSLRTKTGVAAARDALAVAGRDAAEVDMLSCTTLNFQRPYPVLGVEIQNGIGAGGYVFDMNVACSSAVLGLEQAINAVCSGTVRAALVMGPKITSGHFGWKDRDCYFIFGDVCTAMLVERAEDIRSVNAWRVLGIKCAMSFSSNIRNDAGYLLRSEDRSPDDCDQLFRQEDRRVFKEVCPMAAEYIAGHLQQLGHVPTDMCRFQLHQVNLATNQLIGKRLLGHDVPADEAPVILDEFVNIASAGSIIAFHRHRADLEPDDLGMTCSSGASYSIGSVAVQKQ